jgi:hypothetical protein
MVEILIDGRFSLGKKMGCQGSYGLIYSGKNVKSNEPVCIKLEPQSSN